MLNKQKNTFNHTNIYHSKSIYNHSKSRIIMLEHIGARPMLEDSVTHNSTISQDLLKRI